LPERFPQPVFNSFSADEILLLFCGPGWLLLPGREEEDMNPDGKKPWKFPSGRDRGAEILTGIVPDLRKMTGDQDAPSVTEVARKTRSPFKVLVSTVISARTKDEVTGPASRRLFDLAETPEEMAELPAPKISEAIYPAGFYNTKGRSIKEMSEKLVRDFDSEVPRNIDELLTLPGVGRKTANLVLTQGFGIDAICVDTHVHRIVNRLGVIDSKDPAGSEYALREILPREHWIEINDLLVSFGKKICRPISPFCSRCLITEDCGRAGVESSR
jgi:endonuclease-3